MSKMTQIRMLWHVQICSFSTSLAIGGRNGKLGGRDGKHPYDRRFGIRPSDVNSSHSKEAAELKMKLNRGVGMPQPPGVYTSDGKFCLVEEMIPKFIVPDLKDFKLKPYVSYRCANIKQSEFTAKDLFDAAIAKDLLDDLKGGKIDLATLEKKVAGLKLSPNTEKL